MRISSTTKSIQCFENEENTHTPILFINTVPKSSRKPPRPRRFRSSLGHPGNGYRGRDASPPRGAPPLRGDTAPSLAESFVVGGRKHRWAPDINYTDWADQNQFHVGDWLGTILPFLPLHTLKR